MAYHWPLPSGYVAQVDETVCGGCGTCEETCPFEAAQLKGTAVINRETCMGCGVCVTQCPSEAISLLRDEKKVIPLDVRMLAEEHRESRV
ncbi:MAG: 4Fe-4S binding protein [Calditrichota bacterium]|jgi:Na+-translocating ferredoxin:NAD+ oxidoreductase subunit B